MLREDLQSTRIQGLGKAIADAFASCKRQVSHLCYRALDIDYDQGSGATLFKFDVLMHGPLLGAAFRF
jgi:hypothetical protein